MESYEERKARKIEQLKRRINDCDRRYNEAHKRYQCAYYLWLAIVAAAFLYAYITKDGGIKFWAILGSPLLRFDSRCISITRYIDPVLDICVFIAPVYF